MIEFLSNLFNTSDFPARWHCGQWSDGHGWMHITSDVLIFGAYMAIPLLLASLYIRRRGEIPFPRLVAMFVAFVACCGMTHLVEAIIFWQPVYRFAGTLKVTTAAVSWMTVAALIPALPRMMAMRFPEALEREVAERTAALEAQAIQLRATQAQLAQTNRILQEKNSEMEEFTHTVSHDLRTPLVSIAGFLDLALEALEQEDQTAAQSYLHRVATSRDRMDSLLIDLLNISRVAQQELTRQMTPIMTVIDDVLLDLNDHLTQEQSTVTTTPTDVRMNIAPIPFRQLVENLITNASKYGAGQVHIQVVSGESSDTLMVDDNGPGIPLSRRTDIFGLFERLDTSSQGNGVGLAIVARVAERHSGTAWVENSPLGGARFCVEVPHG